MIIDETYFTGKLNIPNVQQAPVNTNLVSNNSILDRIIKEYSFKYLSDVFGVIVAKDILSKVDSTGAIIPGTDQKYIDLIEGNGSNWLGLRYEVNGVKYSQIANYCYCQYLNETETKLTNIGNTIDESEKGKILSSWNKFNEAWREMFVMRQPKWFEVYGYPYYDYTLEVDVKNLYDYITDSPDWDNKYFKMYENTNKFGL